MTTRKGPNHVVVDGSNIATEGRSMPSLAQLNDAVMSFMEEHPDAAITVVVDATFGHRIDKREAAEFEAGISNNELVAPPAGAVGRGDAFVLSIAQKAHASILSNDSFQEFHADYEWLFDEGRLIGGKPVPHVGWVFVDRVPVRGPVSRKATQGSKRAPAKRGEGGRAKVATSSGSPLANEPMPVPKSPPPGRAKAGAAPARTAAPAPSTSGAARSAPKAGEVVNELMPFLEFVEHHPIGTSVNGIVESYSSHGAYISIGSDGVRGYIPLRLMADPAPTSARKVMQVGEAVTVVVVSFSAPRRSIDCALPDMAGHAAGRVAADEVSETAPAPAVKRPARKAGATKTPAKTAAARKTPAKTAAAKTAAAKTAPAKKTPAKKTPASTATAPAKKIVARKATAETATEVPAAKASGTSGSATAARKTAAKTAGKPTAAKKTAAKTPAKQTAAKQTAAKQTAAKQTAAKQTAAKQTAAKKTAAKKTAGRRAAAGG